MKFAAITTVLALVFGYSSAQYNTGDVQLNASLVQIDDNAKLNFSVFKADISVTYGVSETKLDSWSVKLGMKGVDIYLILEMSKILNNGATRLSRVPTFLFR